MSTYKIEFTYPDPTHQYDSVHLAGSFNNWSLSENQLLYDSTDKKWITVVYLSANNYKANDKLYFKYIINNNQWTCSNEIAIENDDNGISNNCLTVTDSFLVDDSKDDDMMPSSNDSSTWVEVENESNNNQGKQTTETKEQENIKALNTESERTQITVHEANKQMKEDLKELDHDYNETYESAVIDTNDNKKVGDSDSSINNNNNKGNYYSMLITINKFLDYIRWIFKCYILSFFVSDKNRDGKGDNKRNLSNSPDK